MYLPIPRLYTCAFIATVFVTIVTSPTAQAASSDSAYVGDANVCLGCHNDAKVTAILQRPHAQLGDARTPFANHGCETCHGPAAAHVASIQSGGNPVYPPIRFEKDDPTPVSEKNKVCLGCHQGGQRINWAGSDHSANNLACVSCHTVHARRDRVQSRATQPQVCYGCHYEKRAQSRKRSHHPINEGKVVCSDCHNPHGSFGPHQLAKNTVNETCYQCHQEKRGPFLWEHAPVTDSCVNCHNPHGTSQPRMLKVRTPYLCNTCHSNSFHPSDLRSGSGIPPVGADDRLLAGGCLNCHPMVHGSNHPSGPRLTR